MLFCTKMVAIESQKNKQSGARNRIKIRLVDAKIWINKKSGFCGNFRICEELFTQVWNSYQSRKIRFDRSM